MEGVRPTNNVFIATSLDGYIADAQGGIDWLHEIPNPDQIDMGYSDFMAEMDALVMGRSTYETVRSFDMAWPYDKPVYVLSTSMREVPEELTGKVFLVKGDLTDVLETIHAKGHMRLYVDGGKTIQSFLAEDLIDKMVITKIPILLGEGISLFGHLETRLDFRCVHTQIFLNSVVQNTYEREKK